MTSRLPVFLLTVFLCGCASHVAAVSKPVRPHSLVTDLGLVPPRYITVVVMENHSYSEIIGSSDAPYINSLVAQGALMTDSHGVTHPSEPNYLALFSGSTQGIADDSCPNAFDAPSIAGELAAAGLSYFAYAENLPNAGWLGCVSPDGLYARKHVPSLMFSDSLASNTVPFEQLAADLVGTYPNFAFITPNLCSDMHDCSVSAGDAWLANNLPPIVDFDATNNGLLILTWDEDDYTDGNHIATILVGSMVQNVQSAQTIDHYGVLRTIEDLWGLPALGASADAVPITDVWTAPGATFDRTRRR